MKRFAGVPDDFEAVIRITPEHEGGRRVPTFNGIRWDLGYSDDPPGSSIYMVWPDFLDEHGDSRPRDVPLPVGVELPAAMTVISAEMRPFHRERIREGTLFYCQEGGRRVASGRVKRITNLPNERSQQSTGNDGPHGGSLRAYI
jgi:hypothetical protein